MLPDPIVIVGAGLAGLTTALHLAEFCQVTVLCKRNLTEAATAWAQGGIVGVISSDDSVESHVSDTQIAGAGLVDEATAEFISKHSIQAIKWLVDQGVPFSSDPQARWVYTSRARAGIPFVELPMLRMPQAKLFTKR